MFLEQKQIPLKLKPPTDEDYEKYNELYMSENESLERDYDESDEVRSTTTIIMQTPLKTRHIGSAKKSCGSPLCMSDEYPVTPPRSTEKVFLENEKFKEAFNLTLKFEKVHERISSAGKRTAKSALKTRTKKEVFLNFYKSTTLHYM